MISVSNVVIDRMRFCVCETLGDTKVCLVLEISKNVVINIVIEVHSTVSYCGRFLYCSLLLFKVYLETLKEYLCRRCVGTTSRTTLADFINTIDKKLITKSRNLQK